MKTQEAMTATLQTRFEPAHLELVNESYKHNVPSGSETHFKLTLATDEFAGASQVRRHQLVYAALQGYLDQGVHALALNTLTPQEWSDSSAQRETPDCLGGHGK